MTADIYPSFVDRQPPVPLPPLVLGAGGIFGRDVIVGVRVGVGVSVGVGVAVAVGDGVKVAVKVKVNVGVNVYVGVGVFVGVNVAVARKLKIKGNGLAHAEIKIAITRIIMVLFCNLISSQASPN
jgi:hypothetical protein